MFELVQGWARDPWPTCRTLFDICLMRMAIAQPCIGSSAMTFRIRRSRVPWTRSVGLLTRGLSSLTDKRVPAFLSVSKELL
jgi:hypothetical protein